MKAIKDILIAKAKKQFEEISPLFAHTDFEDSFTVEGNKLIFWFLTGDKSSHVLIADIKCSQSTSMSACAAGDVSSCSSSMQGIAANMYMPKESMQRGHLITDYI